MLRHSQNRHGSRQDQDEWVTDRERSLEYPLPRTGRRRQKVKNISQTYEFVFASKLRLKYMIIHRSTNLNNSEVDISITTLTDY